MSTKIALIGEMGTGKSSIANIFAGKKYFKVGGGTDSTTKEIDSFINNDVEIFDTQGLNEEKSIDEKNLQKMIIKFKEKRMNAILLVLNGEKPRIDNPEIKIIKSICHLFMGKYIWKQVGLVFTHYSSVDDLVRNQIEDIKEEYITKVLKYAEEGYSEIDRLQDSNNKKVDLNEKIADTLECFYVESVERKGEYSKQTLDEIERIKEWAKSKDPICKVQSHFLCKTEKIPDQTGDFEKIIEKEKEKGLKAVLRKIGSYALGVICAVSVPGNAMIGGACKLIGLPFDEYSAINEIANSQLSFYKYVPKFFNEYSDNYVDVIKGVKYEKYDIEKKYYSDGFVEINKINVKTEKI